MGSRRIEIVVGRNSSVDGRQTSAIVAIAGGGPRAHKLKQRPPFPPGWQVPGGR